MDRTDEISSTEKLLDVIRGNDEEEQPSDGRSRSSSISPARKSSFSPFASIKKSIAVGVDIGFNEIKLIKLRQPFDRKREILDFRKVTFNPDLPRDSQEFIKVLRLALVEFCGSPKRVKIWSIISSAMVEIRLLRIPRLSKNQVAQAVYATYKKDAPFDDNEMIFDFEPLNDVLEDGLKKTEVLAYTAPEEEIEELNTVFSKAGFPLTGITTVPFAIQNFFRTKWIDTDEESACSLYIGRNWSRIDMFLNGNLVLSRGIKAGMNSMVEAIRENLNNRDIEITVDLDEPDESDAIELDEPETRPEPELANEPSLVENEDARRLFTDVINGASQVSNDAKGIMLNETEIFEMIEPALERLVRQLERTLEHFSLNIKEGAVDKIYIQGQVGDYFRVVEYIQNQLNISVGTIGPLFMSPALKTDNILDDETVGAGYAPSLGLALSDMTNTPNFIHTYKDKEIVEKKKRTHRVAAGILVLLILALSGVYFAQNPMVTARQADKTALAYKLTRFKPKLDELMVTKLVARIKINEEKLVRSAKKYLTIAAINEITNMTPANVRLLELKCEVPLEGEEDEDVYDYDDEEESSSRVIMEGLVIGKTLNLESILADYLVKLGNSTIFSRPRIKARNFEKLMDEDKNVQDVLKFTAELDLI